MSIFLPASKKSMNAMQKYPHIIELFDCFLNMLTVMFLTNSLLIWSAPKLSKQTISVFSQNKAIQYVPTSGYSSKFIT